VPRSPLPEGKGENTASDNLALITVAASGQAYSVTAPFGWQLPGPFARLRRYRLTPYPTLCPSLGAY